MDLTKVLAQLREELANLDAAIASLERLPVKKRGRGRPPKALSRLKPSIKSERPTVRKAD
jgi:hypothetical protein